MLINSDNEHFQMSHETYFGYKILTQVTLASGYGFIGYFTIYRAGDNAALDKPLHRESRHIASTSSTMSEALEGAHQRAIHWIEENGD